MSSAFPSGIDTFVNPIYNKTNGVDYINASHVNDLQDAMRACQRLIVGQGNPAWLNYGIEDSIIAPNSSVKQAFEQLDQSLRQTNIVFREHKEKVLFSDPSAHHASVVAVTSVQYLSAQRVQQALEILVSYISKIMTGQEIAGLGTLDSRYILSNQDTSVNGNLTILKNLIVNQDCTLGQTLQNIARFSGNVEIGNELTVNGAGLFNKGFSIKETERIEVLDSNGEKTNTFIDFSSGLNLHSKGSIVLKLDSDSLINPELSSFTLKNDGDVTVFEVNEAGVATVSGEMKVDKLSVLSDKGISLGGNDVMIKKDQLSFGQGNVVIKLDTLVGSETESLSLTKNNYSGVSERSQDLLLKVTEEAMVGPEYQLQYGKVETGMFGYKSYCPNAGGTFYGFAINFKHTLYDAPISISLTPISQKNIKSVRHTHLNEYGAFIEVEPANLGSFEFYGTYQVVSGG